MPLTSWQYCQNGPLAKLVAECLQHSTAAVELSLPGTVDFTVWKHCCHRPDMAMKRGLG